MRNTLILSFLMLTFSSAFSQVPTAYLTADYSGGVVMLNTSYPGLDGYRCEANWTRHINAVRVPDGWTVELFEGPNYTGPSTVLTSDVADLKYQGWSDRAVSIKVSRNSTVLKDGICPCLKKAPLLGGRGR